ncbi:MAG: zinc ribbon domain-containing protein [Firmicutes bacterium]|nr:zinc ribbon domain-containing protein [Bacillota bacterium]
MENQTNGEITYCTYCGSQNSKANKYCINCGGPLVPLQAAPSNIQDNPILPTSVSAPQPSSESPQKKKFGIETLAGILLLLSWARFFPLVLAIAVVMIFFYITLPNTRKGILSLVNGVGHLAIGGFVIILILWGACFLMIGLA